LVSCINTIFIAQNVQKQYGKMENEPHFYFSRLLKNTHLIWGSKGVGLLNSLGKLLFQQPVSAVDERMLVFLTDPVYTRQ
jgi:hypothetical protein